MSRVNLMVSLFEASLVVKNDTKKATARLIARKVRKKLSFLKRIYLYISLNIMNNLSVYCLILFLLCLMNRKTPIARTISNIPPIVIKMARKTMLFFDGLV